MMSDQPTNRVLYLDCHYFSLCFDSTGIIDQRKQNLLIFSKYNFIPNKINLFGTRFAEAAILAGRARRLPFWQYPYRGGDRLYICSPLYSGDTLCMNTLAHPQEDTPHSGQSQIHGGNPLELGRQSPSTCSRLGSFGTRCTKHPSSCNRTIISEMLMIFPFIP